MPDMVITLTVVAFIGAGHVVRTVALSGMISDSRQTPSTFPHPRSMFSGS